MGVVGQKNQFSFALSELLNGLSVSEVVFSGPWFPRRARRTDQASTRVSLLSSNPENTTSDTERPLSNSDRAKLNWFFWPTTPLSSDDLRSNTTLCSLKPEFTITTDPTSSSEPLAVNISVSDV